MYDNKTITIAWARITHSVNLMPQLFPDEILVSLWYGDAGAAL